MTESASPASPQPTLTFWGIHCRAVCSFAGGRPIRAGSKWRPRAYGPMTSLRERSISEGDRAMMAAKNMMVIVR